MLIKSRQIAVYPKTTSADTQYWDIDAEDEAYIYEWLYRLLADMAESSTYDPDLQKEWFKRRPGVWPKGKSGPNSHASILGGICSAKLRDPKKNLSTAQLDAVEVMFDVIAQQYAGEATPPVSITFDKKIFSIK
jgi:hypothetical protein